MKRFNAIVGAIRAHSRRTLLPIILFVPALAVFTTTVSAAELVVNGNFEKPVVSNPKDWMTYYGQNFTGGPDCPTADFPDQCNDGTLVPGWSVVWSDDDTPGRLEIQRGPIDDCPPYRGLQKAELDSHHRIGNPDNNVSIFQNIKTCPRSAYVLRYAWKSRKDIIGDNDFDVVVGGVLMREHRSNNIGWLKEKYYFVSDIWDETEILFGSCGDGNTLGIFLDKISVRGQDGSDPANCEDPEEICTDGRLGSLTLLYDGNDFSQFTQDPEKVVLEPEFVTSFPNPAYIMAYDHGKGGDKHLAFAGIVQFGELFTIEGTGKKGEVKSTTRVDIFTETGELVQKVIFHTSCSQPLNLLDEFGGITVWGAEPRTK